MQAPQTQKLLLPAGFLFERMALQIEETLSADSTDGSSCNSGIRVNAPILAEDYISHATLKPLINN